MKRMKSMCALSSARSEMVPQHGEGQAEVVAHLRQRRTFHLHRERRRQRLTQRATLGRGADEAVAADDQPAVQRW